MARIIVKKICPKCELNKDLIDFHNLKSGKYGKHSHCKSCRKEFYTSPEQRLKNNERQNRRYNSQKRRDYRLQSEYGMSQVDYDNLLERQNYCCAICKKEDVLHVDHCHRTKVIRGLLCTSCNNGLGRFKDNPAWLVKASGYVMQTALL